MLTFDEAILLKCVCRFEEEKSYYRFLLKEEDFLRPELTASIIDRLLWWKDVELSSVTKKYRITEKGRDSLVEAMIYYRNKTEFLLEDSK